MSWRDWRSKGAGGTRQGGLDSIDGAGRAGDGSASDDATTGPFGLVPAALRRPPTIGVALAIASYLLVLFSITDVVGGTGRVAAAALLAVVAATVLARVVTVRSAALLTGLLLAIGLVGYYYAVPPTYRELFTVTRVILDAVAMLTGLSVLRLLAADVWALAVAPVPTFFAWYLAARGRSVGAALVAGSTLGFFVLTSDASVEVTLLGVVGVALAVGFETVSVPKGLRTHWDTIVVVVVAMLVVSLTLTVVPGGAAQPWVADRGTPGIESSLVGTQDSLRVVGSVQLSPEVRFVVESREGANWHTASYDRYTGDGWVKTGETRPYGGELSSPPGTTVRLEQTITAKTDMGSFPAAWKAVSVEGPVARSAVVSDQGGLQPGTTVMEDDVYVVESEVVQAPPDELRGAPEEYPADIERRYTQLPESTPDRVGDLTDEVVASADADDPYDQAVAIERYLEQSKEYSLNVQRPDGDVADEFLFEMEAGYCTYFATTMVAMLRTQGIPAKFVTGYSTGERVGQDEWVVRGQDAHAWVMVYFPEHGWVEFDPTPSGERENARQERLDEARAAGDGGIDTEETGPEDEPDGGGDESNDGTDEGTDGTGEGNDGTDEGNGTLPSGGDSPAATGPDGSGVDPLDPTRDGGSGEPGDVFVDAEGVTADETGSDPGPTVPDRDTVGYGLLALLGLVVGVTQTGAANRAYRVVWLRYQRRREPTTDVERAYARLEFLLKRQYRARRPGETVRDYHRALMLRGLDDRAQAVGEIYERSVYEDGATEAEADEAVRTVTRLALEATPIVGRFVRRPEASS